MSRNEHTPFIENISAYALGALDADESAALESHLTTCASCRTELAEFRLVSESLLTTVPSKQPSPALRQRLQNRLPSAQKSTRPKLVFSFNRLAMGLVVIALFVLNIFTFMQVRQLQNQQALLLNQVEDAQVALALLSSPNIQLLSINNGDVSGTLLMNVETNQAMLIARNLPSLAENKTYQIWLIEPDNGRVSVGLFRPESGQPYITKAISPTQSFADYLGIGVTIEPAGGSDYPTGERVFKVDF